MNAGSPCPGLAPAGATRSRLPSSCLPSVPSPASPHAQARPARPTRPPTTPARQLLAPLPCMQAGHLGPGGHPRQAQGRAQSSPGGWPRCGRTGTVTAAWPRSLRCRRAGQPGGPSGVAPPLAQAMTPGPRIESHVQLPAARPPSPNTDGRQGLGSGHPAQGKQPPSTRPAPPSRRGTRLPRRRSAKLPGGPGRSGGDRPPRAGSGPGCRPETPRKQQPPRAPVPPGATRCPAEESSSCHPLQAWERDMQGAPSCTCVCPQAGKRQEPSRSRAPRPDTGQAGAPGRPRAQGRQVWGATLHAELHPKGQAGPLGAAPRSLCPGCQAHSARRRPRQACPEARSGGTCGGLSAIRHLWDPLLHNLSRRQDSVS